MQKSRGNVQFDFCARVHLEFRAKRSFGGDK